MSEDCFTVSRVARMARVTVRMLHHYDDIGLLDEPEYDRSRALRAQRDLLTDQVRRTEAIIRAVDATLDALQGEGKMDTERMFDGFDEFDASKYEEEARERWGETEAYRESSRRTRRYTPEDWARIQAEMNAIEAALAEMLAAGRRPDEDEVAALAERHRLHIDHWYYPCSHDAHTGLAEMYLVDPRFREHFDRRRDGLAEYVANAIRANGARTA